MTAFKLRRAKSADAAAIASLFRRVRQASLPYLPDLHTPEEDGAFFAGTIAQETVWVAECEGTIVGFIAHRIGWIDHLYVDLARQRNGIGTALLERAMATEGEIRLWVFRRNVAARRFYERRGFRLVKETDGADNEEKEPDALLEWRPSPDRSRMRDASSPELPGPRADRSPPQGRHRRRPR